MARPVVLVYQEFATVTTTPDTPELNCLVAGPAYWIQDYLDDKASIQTASDYGTKDADNPYIPPAVFTDAITVADPPNNVTGGVLDSSSVEVFLDNARVLIGQDVTTGVIMPTTGLPHNMIDCSGADAAFKTAMTDMKAGDHIILDDPTGGSVTALKRIVLVDTTGGSEAIYTNTNFTASDGAAHLIRVEREVDDIAVSSSFVVVTGNQIIIQGGITTILTGEVVARVVDYAEVYIQYRSLRTDLRSVDTVESLTDITTKIGKIDSRNPLAGVCATALVNTTTAIQFFGVLSDNATGHSEVLEVIEGRDDIYALVPITLSASILAQYKTAVESLASVTLAESTGIPQKFRVVLGAQALVEDEVISGPYAGTGQHKTVDGAIAGTPIAAADDINVFADENATWVTDGVRAGDTLVIVQDATREGSYTVAEVYGERRLRTTTAFPGAVTTSCAYYIIRGTGTPVASTAFTAGVTTAVSGLVVATTGPVTGLSTHVGKVLRLTAGAIGTNNGDWLIDTMAVAGPPAQWNVIDTNTPSFISDTAVVGSLFAPISAVTVPRTCASRRCFRRIVDNNATFTTDLVKATDTLQVPNPQTGTNYTTLAPYDYTVAYIPSENEVILAANEDVIAVNAETGDTTLNFRINRDLTKDDQIDALVSISQSFNSRRVVLVWPDSVDVNGLVDGSKTRTISSTPEAADAQPGYYLAGAVGGLTAGLPSQQGFTNIAIAGVDTIYHSTRYFSDTQLTELSDGGWFVYEQDTPSALPSCIHQLTTDPDTLESGEYSIVKNFDFVSIFFQDILNDYLGIYNINPMTMSLLKQALNTGIDLLKLRSYAKIGAPLNTASITNIQISTAAADRVEINMSVELPKPLNRIGLHLLSS